MAAVRASLFLSVYIYINKWPPSQPILKASKQVKSDITLDRNILYTHLVFFRPQYIYIYICLYKAEPNKFELISNSHQSVKNKIEVTQFESRNGRFLND